MKIHENGTIRDMTVEEISAMQEEQLKMERNIEPLTDNDKIALMLAGYRRSRCHRRHQRLGTGGNRCIAHPPDLRGNWWKTLTRWAH